MLRAYPADPARRAVALVAVALAALALPACGAEGPAEDVEPPSETAQPVPKLPPGWKVDRNDAGGFALGVPPGWRAKAQATRTQLKSADRLVVITVTPDRSNELIEADLEELAESTGARYGEQFEDFELGHTDRFEHVYDGYSVTADGRRDGVRQEIELILLRRGEIVTFTVIVQRNERFGTAAYRPTIERIVRSLRSRPVG
ncbi:MAG TPA: hypothetical protein VFY99_02920 [Solirubrobacterales bacterium]